MINGKYKYTDKELETILKSMIFLIDTQEKEGKHDHILEYFDKNKISYINKKLPYGDYSFMIPQNTDLGIMKDISFEDEIVIERKANLDELAGNLVEDKGARILKEFALCKAKMKLMIENNTYNDLCTGNYKSQYKPKSFMGKLHSIEHRYNIPFHFVEKQNSGRFIYCTCYYYLREQLK